jgi:mannosyltransferase
VTVLLLAAGAVLRLAGLTTRSLWFDEAATLVVARAPLGQVPGLAAREQVGSPLYYWLIHVWMLGFSDPRFAMRIFSAACAIAGLFVFRGLCEKLLPARARSFALFLAACSSYWIHAAQDGRPYALLLLVCLASTRAAWDLSEKPTAKRWAAYAALAALGLYVHYYFAVLLFAHAVWLFPKSKRERAHWLAAHAAAALAFVPCLGIFRIQLSRGGAQMFGEALSVGRLLDLLGTQLFDVTYLGILLPAWLTAAVGAAVVAAAAFVASRLRVEAEERRAILFPLAHLALPLLAILAVERALGRPVTQARYLTPLAVFPPLLAARAVCRDGLAARAGRLILALTVLAGTAGYYASGSLIDPRFERLASVLRSTDKRLPVVYLETYYYLPLRAYYLPERPHFLVARAAEGMEYSALPPYDGVADDSRLRSLGPCVVMDEKGVLGGPKLALASGADVARRLGEGPAGARP